MEEVRIFDGALAQVELSPDAILVFYTDKMLSDKAYERIQEQITSRFPGRTTIMLEDGLKVGVLNPTELVT